MIRINDIDSFCVNYTDDILTFSETFSINLEHINKLLTAIIKEGFRLKLMKCNFAKNSVKYVSHIIENNVTKPIQDNVFPNFL